MQRFLTILAFYKPFVVWSFVINIALTIVNPYIIPAVITKLLLTVFVWYLCNETHAKRKLIFYNNLGISSIQLFSVLFFIDAAITIGFLEVIKEFI